MAAASLHKEIAGSARQPGRTGWTNSTALCCASVVAAPPPMMSMRPPAKSRSAMAAAHATNRSAKGVLSHHRGDVSVVVLDPDRLDSQLGRQCFGLRRCRVIGMQIARHSARMHSEKLAVRSEERGLVLEGEDVIEVA